MHQRLFVVFGCFVTQATGEHAEVGQQFAYVREARIGQRQVVSAARAGDAAEQAAGGIAIRLGAVDQHHIAPALARQPPGGGQAGHAGAEDGHAAAQFARGRRKGCGLAQRMALAQPRSQHGDERCGQRTAGQPGQGGQRAGAGDEVTALHRICRDQSSSK